MKHIFLFLAIFLFSLTAAAQVPTHFVYNLVVRDSADLEVKNDTVSVEVSIVRDSAMGQSQYSEVHTAVTSVSGLVSLEVGTGTDTSGNLSAIDWKAGPYYLQTRTDVAGGTNYGPPTAIEMVSVPYALYSNRSDTAHTASFTDTLAVRVSKEGDTLFLGTAGQYVLIPGLSEANSSSGGLQDTTTEVVEVVSAEGRIWMDRNLGAQRAALSSDDSLAYGALYQWGRSVDGHQCRESDTTSMLASTAASSPDSAWYGKFILNSNAPYDWLSTPDSMLWQGVNGVNNPCPTGFRLPTATEWQDEIDSWSDYNSTGAFASPLKLPVSGRRNNSSGDPFLVGSLGLYWSSSVSGSNAYRLVFRSDNAELGGGYRAYGYAVRCIKDY